MNKPLSFVEWFLPFTVFTVEIGMVKIAGIQFDWISQPFFIGVFILYFHSNRMTFNKYELMFFMFLLAQGIINIFIFHLPPDGFFLEFLPIVIIYFVNKSVIELSDIKKVFQRYILLAYYAAIIGIIQVGLKLFFGFRFLTPFSNLWLDSVALEPSHYVLISLPAAIYLFEMKKFNKQFFIIVLSILLTFKITAFASISIYFVLTNFQKFKKIIFFSPVIIYLLYLIIIQFPEFYERYFNIVVYFQTGKLSTIKNLTAFSFASNFEVALENFKNTFGMGIGLGGHETMYYRHFGSLLNRLWFRDINAASAHSLTIRIFQRLASWEFCYLLVLSFKILKMPKSEYKVIAMACLSHFIVKSIKLGGYFDYGTMFFFTMILVILIQNKNSIPQPNYENITPN